MTLFTFLQFKSLLKRDLLQKERICSHGEQILSVSSRPLFKREVISILTELPPPKVSFPLQYAIFGRKSFYQNNLPSDYLQFFINCCNFNNMNHKNFTRLFHSYDA